jgi:hypothetical protein
MYIYICCIVYSKTQKKVEHDLIMQLLFILWRLVHIGIHKTIVKVHFGMQAEDIVEHTNGECHVFISCYARGRYS